MEPEPIAEILSGMPPDRVVESYLSRKLEALSETELFRAAAHIVSQPKLELSSFRLHAPLEPVCDRWRRRPDKGEVLRILRADACD